MDRSHHEIIESQERELVSPDTRKDLSRMDELIADDFEEFGSSGRVFRKPDVLAGLDSTINYSLTDFSFRDIAEGITLVKYKSRTESQAALRSSIWVKTNGNWRLLHHQATVVPHAT
ncbi:MAG: DUF4440 domain-containing protein [Halioglobus sp.]